jgi:hypothetical protein
VVVPLLHDATRSEGSEAALQPRNARPCGSTRLPRSGPGTPPLAAATTTTTTTSRLVLVLVVVFFFFFFFILQQRR